MKKDIKSVAILITFIFNSFASVNGKRQGQLRGLAITLLIHAKKTNMENEIKVLSSEEEVIVNDLFLF